MAFYGFALIYLLGVVVQFFLAGLAVFGVRGATTPTAASGSCWA